MLRGYWVREFLEADTGANGTAGASPAGGDPPPSSEVAESAAQHADEGAADEEDDETDIEPLSVAELEQEIAKLRRQAARRRVERNRAREEAMTLRARVSELEQAATAAAAASQPDPAKEANDRAAVAERRALLVEVAGEVGISVGLLKTFEAVGAAADADALRAALGALSTAIGSAAGRQIQESNPTPPAQPSQPLSLRDQIREAEQKGTVAQRVALKTGQLVTNS